MKELYSFEVTHEEKPVKIILKKPSQRELEDGETEYSIAISHFIRRGVMTKLQLHKQIADYGGILPEKIAKEQNDRYTEFYDIKLDLTKITSLPKEKVNNEEKERLITRMMELQRDIAAVEQVYNQAYNHTAEKKSENRVAMWWFYKILHIQRKEDVIPFRLFGSDSYEENQHKFHTLVEDEDSFFETFRQRAMGLVGYWMNSDAPSSEEMTKVLAEFDETIVKILNGEEEVKEEVQPEESTPESDPEADKEFDTKKKVKPKVSKKK